MDPEFVAVDALYDYVYVDRKRIEAYAAQLSQSGVLSSVRSSAQDSKDSRTTTTVGIPHAVEGARTAGGTASQGVERSYDAQWLVPLDVLTKLDEQGFIQRDLARARLGNIVRVEGALTVFDLRLMRELYDPMLSLLQGQQGGSQPAGQRAAQKTMRDIVSVVKALPHGLQGTIADGERSAFFTLDPQHIIGVLEDFALKHGASVAGRWSVIGVLDASPTPDGAENQLQAPSASPGPLSEAATGLLDGLRQLFGRRDDQHGLTPLVVYRTVERIEAEE